MGKLYMFNTFGANLMVTVNTGTPPVPISGTTKSTGYTPSNNSVDRAMSGSGNVILNGFNTLSIQPVDNYGNPTGPPEAYSLTIPVDIDITSDLLLFIFRTQITLMMNTGFLISTSKAAS